MLTRVHPLFAVDDLAIKLVRLHLHVPSGNRDGHSEMFLDVCQESHVVVPRAAALLRGQVRVVAVAPAGGAPLAVVPHLFLLRGHQGYGQSHALGSAYPANTVHIVGLVLGKVHVDQERQPFHVQASRGDVGADEEVDLRCLEKQKVKLF